VRRPLWRRFVREILPPALVLVVVVVALQIWVKAAKLPAYEMPAPTAVAASLSADRSELFSALWNTTQGALIGFAASAVLGTIAAIILASSPWVRRAFYPYTLFFQTVPIVAVAPLLVFWFNYGLGSVAISAFVVSVFPVIANALAGLLSTDPALLDLFRLYRASPLQRLVKLRLPAALPSILSGLRVAAGLAVIGTVVAEFLVGTLGADEGLGVKIVGALKVGHMDKVFAAIVLASLLGLAMLAAVELAGWFAMRRWHASAREDI